MSQRFFYLSVLLMYFSVSAATAQQGRPPVLDFNQFRQDIAEASSASEKLDEYVEMSLRAVRQHPDSLFTFAQEIREIEGIDESKKDAFEQLILANAWRVFDRDSSIHYATLAAGQLKEIGEETEYLRIKNLLGLEYSRKLDYISAENAYLEGVAYAETADSAAYPVHYFYGNLGNLYAEVGAHDRAVEMFEKFTTYDNTPQSRCNTISKLAVSLSKMEAYEKAEQMLVQCLEYDILPPPINSLVRSNLSKIYEEMGRPEESLDLLEQATEINVHNRVPNLNITHLIRLGNMYLSGGDVVKADSVRQVLLTTPFRGFNHHFSINKSVFLTDLSYAKGEFERALAHADSAISIAEESGLQHFLRDVYKTRSQAFEKLGRLDEALENERLQDELDQKNEDRKEERELALMKVRYQLNATEATLTTVSSRLISTGATNNLLIGVVFCVLLIAGYTTYHYRRSKSTATLATSKLQEHEVTILDLEDTLLEQNQKLVEKNIPEWVEFNSKLKLSLEEIRYIQSDGNYVKIFLSDSTRAPMMERMTLKECEEQLPGEIMLRIHRSTIVNIQHASHVSNEMLYLKDNTELKISRRYKKEVVEFLG